MDLPGQITTTFFSHRVGWLWTSTINGLEECVGGKGLSALGWGETSNLTSQSLNYCNLGVVLVLYGVTLFSVPKDIKMNYVPPCLVIIEPHLDLPVTIVWSSAVNANVWCLILSSHIGSSKIRNQISSRQQGEQMKPAGAISSLHVRASKECKSVSSYSERWHIKHLAIISTATWGMHLARIFRRVISFGEC